MYIENKIEVIMMTYRAGVMGAAGFAGIELVRILLAHPEFELKCATSDSYAGMRIEKMYPAFRGFTDLSFSSNEDAHLDDLDVVFLAVPHTVAMNEAPGLLEAGVTVIDLSADFRLKDPAVYERYYDTPHTQRALLGSAAFGLPEVLPAEIARAAARHREGEAVLVACAGCYPTATSLAAAPALEAGYGKPGALIIADAISGVTGAGKKATERTHFCFAHDNVEAYGVTTHRHTPEIEQILGIEDRLIFTPHLAPMNRGILSTVTIPLDDDKRASSTAQLLDLYGKRYEGGGFVTVLPEGVQPRTSSVVGTNHAHIGVVYDAGRGAIVATCAIDNLCKGAAGQAVQCANLVFGLDAASGLGAMALPV